MVQHALSWAEALTIYLPRAPAAERAQQAPELAVDYDQACGWVEDRLAFLARHAGARCPV